MSENAKNNSCLHCSVFSTKYQYQEIFDEFGIELGLQSLLAKHFQFDVFPDPQKQQLLCEVCVNNLIRLFDIDELERERDAAKEVVQDQIQVQVQDEAPTQEEPIVITEVQASPSAARPAKNEAPPKPLAKVLRPVPIIPPRAPSARLRKSVVPAPQITPKPVRSPAIAKEPSPDLPPPKSEAKLADQEQISVLMQNILDEDEAIANDESIVEEVTCEDPQFAEQSETAEQMVLLNSESAADPNLEEDVYIYEQEGLFIIIAPFIKHKLQPKIPITRHFRSKFGGREGQTNCSSTKIDS